MRHRASVALALLSLVAAGCAEAATLVVDLRTDYGPGTEIDEVVTGVPGGPTTRRPIARGEDLIAGRRVAELELPAGDVLLTVSLRRRGREVASRTIQVSLGRDTAVTAVINRACEGSGCPEACEGGTCVPYACTPEAPEACPSALFCEDATDCAPIAARCAATGCVASRCFEIPVPGICDPDSYCDRERGCLDLSELDALGVGFDGGVEGLLPELHDGGLVP